MSTTATTPSSILAGLLDSVKADLPSAVNIISALVPLLVPGGTVIYGGLTVAAALGIANGLAKGIPQIEAIWNEMTALSRQGTAPTPEQWAKWNAEADAAYQTVEADLAALKAGKKPVP